MVRFMIYQPLVTVLIIYIYMHVHENSTKQELNNYCRLNCIKLSTTQFYWCIMMNMAVEIYILEKKIQMLKIKYFLNMDLRFIKRLCKIWRKPINVIQPKFVNYTVSYLSDFLTGLTKISVKFMIKYN